MIQSSLPQGSIRAATKDQNSGSASSSSNGHNDRTLAPLQTLNGPYNASNSENRASPLRSPGGPMTTPEISGQRPASASSSPRINDYFPSGAPYRPPILPAQGRSASSLKTITNANGARTISAAAFKRAPPRAAVPSDAGTAADISPLSFQKRAMLPSSPYPSSRIADESGGLRSQGADSGTPPEKNTDLRPSLEGDESFDYISAYVNQMDNVEDSPRQPAR